MRKNFTSTHYADRTHTDLGAAQVDVARDAVETIIARNVCKDTAAGVSDGRVRNGLDEVRLQHFLWMASASVFVCVRERESEMIHF